MKGLKRELVKTKGRKETICTISIQVDALFLDDDASAEASRRECRGEEPPPRQALRERPRRPRRHGLEVLAAASRGPLGAIGRRRRGRRRRRPSRERKDLFHPRLNFSCRASRPYERFNSRINEPGRRRFASDPQERLREREGIRQKDSAGKLLIEKRCPQFEFLFFYSTWRTSRRRRRRATSFSRSPNLLLPLNPSTVKQTNKQKHSHTLRS